MPSGSPLADFTTIMHDLVAVQDELATTAADDFDRRQELRDRENALRLKLRSFRSADSESIDQLKRSLAEAERRIEEHFGNRLSYTSGPQTGYGGGLDPRYLHKMNRAMDDANDLEGMRAEVSRLKDTLNRLEGA